ncbi:hypothetical protein AVEN_208831-1 [Araneus ventricosus]|uniref:RNase H type-1 domain-containing protein n=1 Tax=Araneus ventricosus TaxID=182803 RepID=A0A4Y2NW36_ARAVE|nr:hypothetical protein AVEN_208831-1 [Araneus ventricosus]
MALYHVWSSTGQQRVLTHFQLDKKGSSTPSKESSYLISPELIPPLPGPPFNKLDWIKAHVGHAGEEVADLLEKKATLEGMLTQYPAPRSFLRKKRHAISTQLWQNEWDNDDNGRNVHLILPKVKTSPAPWKRPEIMYVTGHGPFPTYFK